MSAPNYICRHCCHALVNEETFMLHAIKHGIDMTQQFSRQVVSSTSWANWRQVITKITSKEGFEFFETTATDVTPGQMGLGL